MRNGNCIGLLWATFASVQLLRQNNSGSLAEQPYAQRPFLVQSSVSIPISHVPEPTPYGAGRIVEIRSLILLSLAGLIFEAF